LHASLNLFQPGAAIEYVNLKSFSFTYSCSAGLAEKVLMEMNAVKLYTCFNLILTWTCNLLFKLIESLIKHYSTTIC